MAQKVVVFATSFLDDLATQPPGTGEGQRTLEENAKSLGFSLEFRCDRDPHKPLEPGEFEDVVAVIADLEEYTPELLSAVGPKGGGSLRLVSRYGIGYNNVDIPGATKAGVIVTNTPGANARPTAEWALSTLMDVAGRRILHHDRASQGQGKSGPSRLDVTGRTVGIVGTGNIGRNVAELLSGFRPTILASDPYPNNDWAKSVGATYLSLPELCEKSDFITLHAAAGSELIGEKELALMRETTVLVNCARGVLVDNEAAYHAVKEGRIWGYGIDEVWTYDHLPLKGLNIISSPHVGSDSDLGKVGMQLITARQVVDFLGGKTPEYVINREILS